MGSRDDTTPHQPFLSSLVVRPSDSGGAGAGSDYEPGEVRRDAPPPYSRPDRYSDDTGYRARPVSVSPVRRREIDRRYSPELDRRFSPELDRRYSPEPDRLEGSPRRRAFGGGGRGAPRSPGRYRDYSPPHARGRGGRHFGRGFDGRGFGRGMGRGDGMHKNNLNVRPREGDWFCSDPMCGNLNFARREFCNNCKRHRFAPPAVGPRRGFGGPPPPMGPPRRFPGPPMDRSPGRFMNGGPRGWPRDGPRDFGPGGPPPHRHEGRFDHHLRRDFPEDDFRDRGKFGRPPPPEWGADRDHGKAGFMERKPYERRSLSPVPAPGGRGRWTDRDIRERSRSRSPVRGREPYMGRGRDERRGISRDRIGNVY